MDEARLVEADVVKQSAKQYCTNPYTLMTLDAIIDQIPTATGYKKEVHGRWIQYYEESEEDIFPYGWTCSECDRWEGERQPYCNCGCKMDEMEGE